MNQDQTTKNSLINFIEELFPICRSITGNGARETLKKINNILPLEIKEIPTGTKVFDWKIPKEWNIKNAFIKDSNGNLIIDFKKSNLHVVNYSIPINTKLSLKELKKRLHSLPSYPDWIPYRTTYYNEDWGFCLPHNDCLKLKEDTYEVVIDSELKDGSLSLGEFYKKGRSHDEILISTHICHPSMCNDNLSGISVAAHLAQKLAKLDTKYSYRIIFVPATIGSIAWLSLNEDKLEKIKYGLVLALLGDKGKFHYKKSRDGSTKTDKIMNYLLKNSETEHEILDFEPYGYDERQYCSPGINLPVGRLTRTPNKKFDEYHTSADNLDFISKEKLFESYELLVNWIKIIESNRKLINLYPKGEPQLGRRGIYNSIAGNIKDLELAMLWILNYSDGEHELIDIAEKSNFKFNTLVEASDILLKHNILKSA